MSSEVGSRIAKNSVFNLLRTIIAVPIMLAITPYIIKTLGKEEFGIWALVGVISSYAQLSDFGITESLIKFIAEFKAKGDFQRLNQLLNTAMVMYLLLGLVFCLLFILVLPFVVERILNVPPALSASALSVFTIAIVLFFINMLLGIFGSLINGFQRMGYSNAIMLVSTILTALGTVLFLANGYGLQGLIYNNVIITLLVVSANAFFAWRLFPGLRINPFRYWSSDVLRQIFSFSWKVQMTNITQLMIFQLDRVLLSHYLGLAAVSYYEIANRIASHAKGVVTSMFSPMVPAASTLHAVENMEKVAGLYRRSIKYMVIISIPCGFLVIALAHPFFLTWMGPGYDISAYTLQLLSASYMFNLLTGPGAFILSGINKPHIGMRSSVVAGVTNVMLCLGLVQVVGYYGVIIGIFISIVTSSAYFIWMVHRNINGLPWRLYPQAASRPLALSTIMTLVLLAAPGIVPLEGYAALFFSGSLYFVMMFIGLTHGTYLDNFDREMFQRLLPFARSRKCPN